MDPIANDLITELRCYEEALIEKKFCPWNTTTCWDEEVTVTDAEYHQDFLTECNQVAFCAENVTVQGNLYPVY